MPRFLRQKLTKRQARDELKPPSGDGDSPSSTETETNGPHTPAAEKGGGKIAFDDLSTSPPPPPPPPKSPLSETIRRVSPSQSIINRYKHRAPALVAPRVSVPDLKIDSKTGKTAKFSENFDDELSAISPGTVTMADTPTTPSERTADSLRPEGPEGEADLASADGIDTEEDVEFIVPRIIRDDGVKVLDLTPPSKRTTRSEARREERADSAGFGVDEKPKIVVIGRRSTSSSPPEKEKGSDTDVPRGLTIRKVGKLPQTPSPPSNDDQEQREAPGNPAKANSTPAKGQNFSRPFVTKPLIDFCKSASVSPADESSFYPSPDHGSGLSPVPASAPPIRRAPSPPAGPSRSRDISPKKKTDCGLTIVNPPRFDPTRAVQNQWCSFLPTTSRPESPWSWVKRWTCCQCHAQTIVEQGECSRLECGHDKCGSGCKLIKVRKSELPLYA